MIHRSAQLTTRADKRIGGVDHYLKLCFSLFIVVASSAPASGHDEHEALPSTGAVVYKRMVRITPQAEKVLGLEKVKVVLDTWRDEVVVNTTVDIPCTRHAYAAALVPGKIAELLVRPGDEVKQGQVLARVQSLELETLQAQLLQASAQHDLAARTLDQRESLAREGALPQRDLFIARASYREKVAELALLMAKLRAIGFSPDMLTDVILHKEPIRELPIVSPVDGAISLADVRVGQSVDPANHIFHLVDRSELLFVGELLESDIWRVREGMPVRIALASFPNTWLGGKVDHLGLKVDPQRRTMAVRVEMKNPDSRIRPGMFGRMHIEVAQRPEAVVCPTAAVIRRGERYYVLREQGRNHGKYVLTRVVPGQRGNDRIEILDGLYPGQRVVTVGLIELASLLTDSFAIADAEAGLTPITQQPHAQASTNHSSAQAVRQIVVPGRIEAETGRKQFATSTVAGRIATILVERGSPVRRGDMLAEIDSLQLRSLQLDLLGAKVRLDLAQQLLKQLRSLTEDRLVDRNRLWQVESDERSYETKVASLADQLGLLGLEASEIADLQKTDLSKADVHQQITTLFPVRAPADGWVVDFELGVGEVVQPLERLFELQNPSRVWVHARVREGDIGHVGVGSRVTVTIAGDPAFRAYGKVTRTSPLVSDTERVLSVWADLDNADLRLREGMLATVLIDVSEQAVAVAGSAE